ncbi:hypothetical protein HF521_012433, partial [Silurus meridionalis]
MPIEFGSRESFCPYDAKKAESSDLLREEFLPFVSEGFVSPSENSPSQPIRILRDTGASQSLLLKEALPSCGSEDKAMGDFILVQGIEGRIVTVPLHSVFLKSDLVTGQVKVGLMSSLPVKGISLLLGNDLAGGKVIPSVQLTSKPSIKDESKLDLEFFPSCAFDPPVAPLKPIPAFGEPFSRVLVDCVGPLPRTRTGNEYMVTIMCASTRFPEAIPLRNIKAVTVSRALIKFFTLFGLPKEIQSDQGSNFTSGLFQQVTYQLGIKQITSSAYHPESQGALERFHSTLKTMIRTYCFENEKDWDEGVHLLLFAARESIQESLGSSPFELVFGHQVRGPLALLGEQWSNNNTHVNLLDYVLNFKERLNRACALAKENLKATQGKMKTWYDRKARARTFKPGERVLVLFPLQSNPLQARFHGPYEIHSKVNDLNYIVTTPDRRKARQLCHINMLKPYHDRSVQIVSVVSQGESAVDDDCQEEAPSIKPEIISCKLSNSEILQNLDVKMSHLEPWQQAQMMDLVLQHRDLFPDVPKRTHVAVHDVDVGNAQPLKQHPYRMSPEKCRLAEEEVAYMLKNNIITLQLELSVKVNAVSKTDAFPIPRVDDCIDKVGQSKFLTKIDLLKGYWCVPLTKQGREISAFVTPSGLYEYQVLPFGMKNSPATFQRMIHAVIRDLPNTMLLQQDDSDKVEHPVAYFSKKFNRHQRNYSTIEKELLALILALQQFDVYLCTCQKPLIVYTDHNPLVF